MLGQQAKTKKTAANRRGVLVEPTLTFYLSKV